MFAYSWYCQITRIFTTTQKSNQLLHCFIANTIKYMIKYSTSDARVIRQPDEWQKTDVDSETSHSTYHIDNIPYTVMSSVKHSCLLLLINVLNANLSTVLMWKEIPSRTWYSGVPPSASRVEISALDPNIAIRQQPATEVGKFCFQRFKYKFEVV